MNGKKFVNVLAVTVVPLAFATFSVSASADCPPWSTSCTVDPVEIYGSYPPPEWYDYDPYIGGCSECGGGPGGVETPRVQEVMDRVQPYLPCRPANTQVATFVSDNLPMCLIRATDYFSQTYGPGPAAFAGAALDQACRIRLAAQPTC